MQSGSKRVPFEHVKHDRALGILLRDATAPALRGGFCVEKRVGKRTETHDRGCWTRFVGSPGERSSMNPIVRLIGIAVLSLLATACNKPEAPKPTADEKNVPAASKADAPSTAAAPSAVAPMPSAGKALKVAYSDWPGWVAWEVAIQKGWFKEAGVDVEFTWLDYVPTMDAFTAGKVDAVCMTNGDALVTGASGAKSVSIIMNDYSDGNDMIVAKPGITSIAQLKGKTIGVEVGFVDHLLLLHALKAANLKEADVKLKNIKTDQTPQALKSGDVDAIGAWQPSSGAALNQVPGSKPIFTSKDVPGLIYDMLAVNPKSLAERRTDWVKVAKVWDRVAKFVSDEKNLDDAAKIMGARVRLSPDEYKRLMKGTHIMDLTEAKKHWAKADGLTSVYGSNKIVDEFNVKNTVYKAPEKTEEYLDPSVTDEALR
ncbi:MAG TPA: ABC transporter substrate-binding protein [Polyangiaceae bacterium]|nr:ABC transporter substrate-binding protein [Polyangiaceae bacterium]